MDTGQNQEQSPATPKQQVVERLKQAANVLVTVKTNPNVDELAAAIGFTLMLNKLDKHATAVFSGEVPSTLEFLKPEETLESNTDSLRDFIVSLDKSKADKLRYKVEENVVKIYITPYRTSITEEDLEFTQGDFNVDAVVALGVTQREELDQAIMMHGRILHDATVITVTAGQDVSELGQINWQEPAASSLSEMLVSISEAFQGGLIDEQIATAFLTGIVSETERFSNTKTTPKVMTMSAQLMAAGANQQLIANELEKAVEVDVQAQAAPEDAPQSEGAPDSVASSDGTLSIKHDASPPNAPEQETAPSAEPTSETTGPPADSEQEASILPPSAQGTSRVLPPVSKDTETPDSFNPLMGPLGVSSPGQADPPAAGAPPVEPAPDPAPAPPEPAADENAKDTKAEDTEDDGQIHIDHEGNLIRNAASKPKHKVIQPLAKDEASELSQSEPAPEPAKEGVLPPPPELDLTPSKPIPDTTTLEELEKAVDSPHLQEQSSVPTGGVDSARSAVDSALGQDALGSPPTPRADLNAAPLSPPPGSGAFDNYRLPHQPAAPPPAEDKDSTNIAPPPVPPPMLP